MSPHGMAHFYAQEGRKHARAGRSGEAVKAYQRAIALVPTNHRLHARCGVVLVAAGREKEAEGCFRRALEMAPGEKLEASDPHPGEQFGYVLKGTVTLKLGQKEHKVRSNHCFYFEADQSSQIMNKSNSAVKMLWITTPPQM